MRLTKRVYLVGSEQFGLSHPLDCNCYLIDGGSELALVDCGMGLGIEEVLSNISRSGFEIERLTNILVTHAHLGHWGGSGAIRERTKARVWVSSLGASLMSNIDTDSSIGINIKFGRYPAGFVPQSCVPDSTFSDGDRIKVGDVELRMIQVQGHTKDSTCFLFEDGSTQCLFTGDTVFYAGKIGLLNLQGCSLDDYRRDMPKLCDLKVDALLPGHGVFVLKRGQKHIQRAIHKLSDFVLPESFFEDNEFIWDREYLQTLSG
jgi:glyoxylase-like metal-dependent hydrolase (beta-lactamase superfamily II)